MGIFLSRSLERQQILALVRCKQPDNAALLTLFRDRLEEVKESLIAADDSVRLHRLQGRAEVLRDFLNAVEESTDVLEVMDRTAK